ncbi:hypothetical protein BT69DRAFT_1276399 [Atractiella rhizophila]|nr:hypothetical protein BT69DRAFT_1276399 [Atractiella rhizophila]
MKEGKRVVSSSPEPSPTCPSLVGSCTVANSWIHAPSSSMETEHVRIVGQATPFTIARTAHRAPRVSCFDMPEYLVYINVL